MACIYCGAIENVIRERNTDAQGELVGGWHCECDDAKACSRRVEDRRKSAKERARAKHAMIVAIKVSFAEVKALGASPDADTFGNPKAREGQLVLNSSQNHFLVDPPAADRAIWYVDYSGDWGARKVSRAEWSEALESAIREWAAR